MTVAGPSKGPATHRRKRPLTRPRSGKTMARTGLRMMPTSPWSPLKFRTAGFPRYGLKAGISDETFPGLAGFVFVLRAGHRHRYFPALCQGRWGQHSTSMRAVIRSTPGVLAPAGLCCPGHLRLTDPMRPTRRRIPISPPCGLYVMPSLCRFSPGLGNPRVVLSFH